MPWEPAILGKRYLPGIPSDTRAGNVPKEHISSTNRALQRVFVIFKGRDVAGKSRTRFRRLQNISAIAYFVPLCAISSMIRLDILQDFSLTEPTHDRVEHGREENAERRDTQHAAKNGDA